jgi:hypothetical protein
MKLSKKSIVLAATAVLALGFSGCTQQAAASAKTGTVKAAAPADLGLYPPNAKPGECYAKVYIPPKYATKTEKVVVDEGGAKLKVIPPKYGYKTEKRLVREPGYKLVCKPPVYKTVTEKVLVKPASYKLITVPAKYKTVTERVLVSPATTEWRKGSGVTTPIANGGRVTDVNCLVKVPAKYKTVTKRVMVAPPTTKKVPIPAQYKTVRVKTVVEPARTVELKTPPKYSTVTKRIKVSNGYYTWQRVNCRNVSH